MLILKKEDLDRLIAHSVSELPNEACGILAGPPYSTSTGQSAEESVRRVSKVYGMTNAEKSPETFFMDPGEQLKVMKEMRNKETEMVGIYHSHVGSPPYPSAHDVELAFYPDISYVIVSLEDKNRPAARSFKIKDGKISEEEIKIE